MSVSGIVCGDRPCRVLDVDDDRAHFDSRGVRQAAGQCVGPPARHGPPPQGADWTRWPPRLPCPPVPHPDPTTRCDPGRGNGG